MKISASLIFLSILLSTISFNPNLAFAGVSPLCVAPNNGGTTQMTNCNYTNSPDSRFEIINGLPPGNSILSDGIILDWLNEINMPGSLLGGDIEKGDPKLNLSMQGVGFLFNRHVNMPTVIQMHTGPRIPGDPVQMYGTDMFFLQGTLPPGDPDFDLLRITAGTNFGMPSPGHTTLTLRGDGNWNVDSFFDIDYRIDFVGSPGGSLAGMSGSTTGTIRMQATTPDTDGDGIPDDADPDPRDPCNPLPTSPTCIPPPPAVGGEIISLDSTPLLIAGVQSTTWLLPVVLSLVGIGMFVVSRKSENS